MARIRTIKPEWLEDSRMVLASPEARVLSVGLILLADDYGRGHGNPRAVLPRIFPGHSREGEKAWEELLQMGFFEVYLVGGEQYFAIVNWRRHQRVDKPGKPMVPEPLTPVGKIRESPGNSLSLAGVDGPGTGPGPVDGPGTGQPGKFRVTVARLEPTYQLYPVKKGKAKGIAKAAKLITDEADLARFEECILTMSKAWLGKDTTYCPHFSTFVNQERWRDEEWPLPTTKPGSQMSVVDIVGNPFEDEG